MGTTLERDVCIVGAGPAGITMARELDRAGRSVCLLESGGFEYEVPSQELYLGRPPSGLLSRVPNYLSDSRVRMFGGSTNHWTGYCRPLDPVDFEERAWVPNSGWPFGFEELQSFYRRAAPLLQIQPFDLPLAALSRKALAFDATTGIETSLYQKSPPTNFGHTYRQALESSPRVDVLLHANAVDLETDEQASHVKAIRVASLSRVLPPGPRFFGRKDEIAHLTVVSDFLHWNADGKGIYFGVNPRAREGGLLRQKLRAELN